MFFSKIARETDEMANPETSDPAKLAVAVMDYDPHELLVLLNTSEGQRGEMVWHATIIRRVHTPAANLGLCVDHCRTYLSIEQKGYLGNTDLEQSDRECILYSLA